MVEDEEKFYKEIGQFIIQFESVIENIRTGIKFIMYNFNNNNDIYRKSLNIILSEMESSKLIHKYGALLFLYISKDNVYYKKTEELINIVLKLNELRNNLIHRYYSIGKDLDSDLLTIDSKNEKTKKSGLTYNFINLDHSKLKIINDHIFIVNKLLSGLWLITQNQTIVYFKDFDLDELTNIKKLFDSYLK